MKVKDCMCTTVCCVKPETKISEIAKIMNDNHIGCVPVCDNNNQICGILTDRDIILRSIACDKDVKTTTASDIMSTNVCTCKDNDDMKIVEETMAKNKVRRLPVCNEDNHVIGILTLGNLAQNDSQLGRVDVCTTINQICDCDTNKNNQ